MDHFAITTLSEPPWYDFQVGRRHLARHLDLIPRHPRRDAIPWTCALASPDAALHAAWLLGGAASPFPDGRAPLFVCGCGDLSCGAVTVAVDITQRTVRWSDVAWQSPGNADISATPYMQQLGDLEFAREAYEDELAPFR